MNREWIKSVEQQLRELRQRTRGIVARPRAGGGGAGGGSTWIEATTVGGLTDPNTITDRTTMGRVTEGPQIGQIYKIAWDAVGETWVWECVSEAYDAATEAELETGGVIGKYALGRVGDIYYRRNLDNTVWEAQNRWD